MSKRIGNSAAASRGVPVRDIPEQLVELGHIVSAYGVTGWVKIQPYSSSTQTLRDAAEWWLARADPRADLSAPHAYSVLDVRPQGATLVAQLAGIADRDAAHALRGMSVSVPRAAFAAEDDDEYYWIDLIGCSFHGEDDGRPVLLGEVIEVLDNGAHGILKIGLSDTDADGVSRVPRLDEKGRQLEILVPFVRAHVHTVDLAARRIDSNWPADY